MTHLKKNSDCIVLLCDVLVKMPSHFIKVEFIVIAW